MKQASGLMVCVSLLWTAGGLRADNQSKIDPLVQAAAMKAGKMDATEKELFEQSIRTTKRSIADDALDLFYRDALELYREKNYEASLDLLDRIYSVNPDYQDVRSFRATVQRLKDSKDTRLTRQEAGDLVRKGNDALSKGQRDVAMNYYQQALKLNSHYKPALEKIESLNHTEAERQFEDGYRNYRDGRLPEALQNWTTALRLNPDMRQRGLLPLMSKIESDIRKTEIETQMRDATTKEQQGDFDGALKGFESVHLLEPRNQDARKAIGRLKYRLGREAFDHAQSAQSRGDYADAIKSWQRASSYEYHVSQCKSGIKAAEAAQRKAEEAEVKRAKERERMEREARAARAAAAAKPRQSSESQASDQNEAASKPIISAPKGPIDPTQALAYYRKGLAAVRDKDYNLAVDQLETAYRLDPQDRYQRALQRARAEWQTISGQDGKTP